MYEYKSRFGFIHLCKSSLLDKTVRSMALVVGKKEILIKIGEYYRDEGYVVTKIRWVLLDWAKTKKN